MGAHIKTLATMLIGVPSILYLLFAYPVEMAMIAVGVVGLLLVVLIYSALFTYFSRTPRP